MSFTTVKALSLLVYPIIQVWLLLLGGSLLALRRRHYAAGVALFTATAWLWLCSSPQVATSLMEQLERGFGPVAARDLPDADVIILLGGAIRGEVGQGALADMSGVGDRVLFAAAAYRAGKAPVIVVTGGAPEGEEPEAVLIGRILETMGVPAQSIVLETRNRQTLDNAVYTNETLVGLGANSALLVTSAFHMRRSLLVFEGLDVQVYPAPTDFQVLKGKRAASPLAGYVPNVKALQVTTWAFHEFVGYWYYKMKQSPRAPAA